MSNNLENNKHNTNQNINEPKFYEKTWFMWVTLFVFAPVGIFLMWKYKRFSDTVRKILTGVFGLIFLITFFSNGQSSTENNPTPNSQQTSLSEDEIQKSEEDKAKEAAEAKAKLEEKEKAKAEAEAKKTAADVVSEVGMKIAKDRYISAIFRDDSETAVTLTLKKQTNLTKNLSKSTMFNEERDILKELSTNDKFKTLKTINIIYEGNFIDEYGKEFVANAQILKITIESVEKINWDNFLPNDFPKIAEFYFIAPAFQ